MSIPLLFPDEPDAQADRLFTQAMEWLRAGQLDAAQGLLEQAAALNAAAGRLVPEGYARLALGRLWLERGETARARAALEEAATRLAAGGDQVGQIRLLFELGELAEREGAAERAIGHYTAIIDMGGDDADGALAHLRLGAVHRDAGRAAAAAPHYEVAQALFAATGNELGEARAALELARLLPPAAAERAVALFRRGLMLAEDYGQDDLAAVAHLGLAAHAPDDAAAHAHLSAARDLAAAAGDAQTAAQAAAALAARGTAGQT